MLRIPPLRTTLLVDKTSRGCALRAKVIWIDRGYDHGRKRTRATGVIMKRILFGSMALIALGLSAPAMAADMPVKAPPPPPVVWNWSGVYLGAHAGGAWSRTDWSSDFNCAVGVLCDSISQDGSGWL